MFRDLCGVQSWAEPLDDISMFGTFHVDGIYIVLIKVTVLSLWNFNILAVKIEVNFDGIVTQLSHKIFNHLSFSFSKFIHVLVSGDAGVIAETATVLNFKNWVESIEE